jgi:5'-phosphate synthase pdxT subunit
VLALQGDWEAHRRALEDLRVEARAVRTAADLAAIDGLVIPGGESTAMLRLMDRENLFAAIAEWIAGGMPVLATCAGVILLADTVEPEQPSFGILDLTVRRNAYGRQVFSTIAAVDLDPQLGQPAVMEGVFIRAPRIVRVGDEVEVLGRWNDDPVLIRQGAVVGATFHPELTGDRRIHELFVRAGEMRHDEAIAAAQ